MLALAAERAIERLGIASADLAHPCSPSIANARALEHVYQKYYGGCLPIAPSTKPPGKIQLDKASLRASSAMTAAFSRIAAASHIAFNAGASSPSLLRRMLQAYCKSPLADCKVKTANR